MRLFRPISDPGIRDNPGIVHRIMATELPTLIKDLNEFGSRVIIDDFFQDTVPASQAATQLARALHGNTNPKDWICLRDGSLSALHLATSANITAGTATVTLYKNGVALTGMSVSITSGKLASVSFKRNLTQFVRGDILSVYLTTSTYAPANSHMRAIVEVIQQGTL